MDAGHSMIFAHYGLLTGAIASQRGLDRGRNTSW
jgi:hypothetical protein